MNDKLNSTQEPEAGQSFGEVLLRTAPQVGDDLMTYAQERLAEGRAEGEERGKVRTQVDVIEGLMREGLDWAASERVMGVNEAQFQALKQQVETIND